MCLHRDGDEPELAPVSTGSHIDAIPYSGKYDGVIGVLGAIEAINVLKRYAGLTLVWNVELEVIHLLYSTSNIVHGMPKLGKGQKITCAQ